MFTYTLFVFSGIALLLESNPWFSFAQARFFLPFLLTKMV